VFEGLEAVQESEETNMLNYRAVQDIATRMGYPETTLWVREHRHEYSEGIFRGFVAAE
jgi:transposase-like protein